LPIALDYAGVSVPRRPNFGLGVAACVVAVVAAAAIVYLSHDARMAMVTWRGEWCGFATGRAEDRLHMIGGLLLIPAAMGWLGWYAKVGVAVCRAAFLSAVAGWLVYIVF
jgi:hypothetical protein